jgi:hypothetical protein
MTRRRGSRSRKNPPGKRPAGRVDDSAAAAVELQPSLLEIDDAPAFDETSSAPPSPGEAGTTLPPPSLPLEAPLRILWIGTKSPVPPIDGGRLVVLETLRALSEAGHHVVFVAPVEGTAEEREAIAEELRPFCEPVLTRPRRRPAFDDAVRAVLTRQPVTIRRHFRAKVQAAVAGRLSTGSFDVVHCEQVHAVAQAEPAYALGVPVVLRQQNVETDLWSMMARHNPLLRPLVALEGARVRRYEAPSACAPWAAPASTWSRCTRRFPASSPWAREPSTARRRWCCSAISAGSRIACRPRSSRARCGRASTRRCRTPGCTCSAARCGGRRPASGCTALPPTAAMPSSPAAFSRCRCASLRECA